MATQSRDIDWSSYRDFYPYISNFLFLALLLHTPPLPRLGTSVASTFALFTLLYPTYDVLQQYMPYTPSG